MLPLVCVVFVLWRRAHHEGLRYLLQSDLSRRIYTEGKPAVIKMLLFSLSFLSVCLSLVCFESISSHLVIWPLVYLLRPRCCCCSLQNSKAFLKCCASLSIEPVSPSKPCWKLCCSALCFFGLISWYCSVYMCMSACVSRLTLKASGFIFCFMFFLNQWDFFFFFWRIWTTRWSEIKSHA